MRLQVIQPGPPAIREAWLKQIETTVADKSRPPGRPPRSRAMSAARETTERRELQQWVADMAAWMHVLHYHTHDSRHSPAGFPDSVFAGTACLFRELKTEYATLTDAQAAWGQALLEAGEDWDVWRPSDWYPSAAWPGGRVRAELEAITFKIGAGHDH
jgi:hypothetical protein